MLADRRGARLSIGARGAVAVGAAALHRAHQPVREKAAEQRPSIAGPKLCSAPSDSETSGTGYHSIADCPSSPSHGGSRTERRRTGVRGLQVCAGVLTTAHIQDRPPRPARGARSPPRCSTSTRHLERHQRGEPVRIARSAPRRTPRSGRARSRPTRRPHQRRPPHPEEGGSTPNPAESARAPARSASSTSSPHFTNAPRDPSALSAWPNAAVCDIHR